MMGNSHDLLNRLQGALEKLAKVVPQEDHDKQVSLKNAHMWIAIKKRDGDHAVAAFEELVGMSADPNAPSWLAGGLLAAARSITALLPDVSGE
jgi:hypothetical protein